VSRDVVVVACAVSAGIHVALVREHPLPFATAAAVLALLAVLVTFRPGRAVSGAAAATFAGLLVAYGLAVTTGVPLLHPAPEPVDGLGLFTKAVEAAGLLAAVEPLRTKGHSR
jgi:hypothetical protein